jgi:hypothetical protein
MERDESSSSTPHISSTPWVYISDEHCHFIDEHKVLEAEAYMLFYEKVN